MQTRSLEAIVDALDLEQGNASRAVSALAGLNYRPRAPVPLAAFADSRQRADWVADKGLTVFSLWSADYLATEIDLFVEEPLDFAKAYAAAASLEIGPGVVASFVSLDDLIEMKRRAGRPADLDDIEHLQRLRKGPADA